MLADAAACKVEPGFRRARLAAGSWGVGMLADAAACKVEPGFRRAGGAGRRAVFGHSRR